MGLSAVVLALMVFTLGTGCASGETAIGQQVSDGGTSGTSMSTSSMGGDGSGAMGGSSSMGGSAMGGSAMGGNMGGQGGVGGDDPCALGCPADTYDIDDNPLTGTCGCEYSCTKVSNDDPIDPSFTDDNCDGSDGDMEDCVFVSAADGSSAGAGTRLDPVDSIALGISVADANNVSAVCVSGETYSESVVMVSGISVYGGFDHEDVDFKFRRKDTVTSKVQAAGTVFLAENINLETHIEGFTIEAFTPGTAGESTYGVRLNGGAADLYVRYNDIHAFPGANGADGSDGTAHGSSQAPGGNPGGDGCEEDDDPCAGDDTVGGAQPNCVAFGGKGGDSNMGGDGDAGDAGNAGTPAGAGGGTKGTQYSGNTCIPTSPSDIDGDDGTNNTNHGSNGVVGTKGSSVGSVASGAYAPADGGNGLVGVNGQGGPGGGGGGGQDVDTICEIGGASDDAGGAGGSGGCGGLGGDFGRGGGGGGGSFGVFAAAGRVIVTDNSITTDGGGDGGAGGTGQEGQIGGLGASGGTASDDGGNGGDGGNGSNGGDGGPGAGGGGGPCAILGFAPGVIFTLNSNTTALGSAGDGGTGGTNPFSGATAPDGDDGINGVQLQIN